MLVILYKMEYIILIFLKKITDTPQDPPPTKHVSLTITLVKYNNI